MKRFFFFLLAIGSFAWAQAQQTSTGPTPAVLKADKLEFDFGQIPQGKPVYTQFVISNSAGVPIKLSDVHAACGCTTPEWNRNPIAPGGSTNIKVGFNAAQEGPFTKPITITYGDQSINLIIKGTVWKAPDGSAPANASLQFLKKQTL